MRLSIIIPAYNSKETLAECLRCLAGQSYDSSGCEVVVIDDGSSDGTLETAERMSLELPYSLRCFRQEHKGPAAARNIGIKNARGEIVLFLGADIMVSPGFIEKHLTWHEKYKEDNVAVLGLITWPSDMGLTPFLRWLELGAQFAYPSIKDTQNVPYQFFYSSNLSLKKRFLLDNGLFDEDFPYAAYEDIELGYRLAGKGLRMVYVSEAAAYHDHVITPESYRKRSGLAGRSLKIFIRKHPEISERYRLGKPSLAKTIAGNFVWVLPQAAARFIPRSILHKGYKWMTECFVYSAYRRE